MADLRVDLGRIQLKNPVMTASGTFGYGAEYEEFFPVSELGAVVVKGVAPWQSHGNPTPRVAEVTSGMLNAIGLQGPGIDRFLHDEHYMPFLRRLDEDSEGIAAREINVSCPNVKEGGIAFGTDTEMMGKVVSAVRKATGLPLITKLSPNVTKIADFAKAAEDAGSDMISLINTIPAMAIDIETFRPKIANVTGGFSGPAIKPIAVRMVYEAAHAVRIPVIGMGGITTGEDAVEFFLAGAKAVAVGTAIFADPMAPVKVIKGINDYLDRKGFKSVNDIIGLFGR